MRVKQAEIITAVRSDEKLPAMSWTTVSLVTLWATSIQSTETSQSIVGLNISLSNSKAGPLTWEPEGDLGTPLEDS